MFRMTRWLFVVLSLLAAGTIVLAACQPAAAPVTQAPATQPPAAAPKKFEFFSWWTAGGEAEGLNGMFEVFKAKNPGVEIVNATVAGGAGTNAKAVLATRLTGGDPPDSFQVHAGLEVQKYSP